MTPSMEFLRKLWAPLVDPPLPEDPLFMSDRDVVDALEFPGVEGGNPSFQVMLAQFILLHLRERRSINAGALECFQRSLRWDEMALYYRLRSVCEGTIVMHLQRLRKQRRGFLRRVFSSAEDNLRADLAITTEHLYREPVGKLLYHLEDMLTIARERLEETLRQEA